MVTLLVIAVACIEAFRLTYRTSKLPLSILLVFYFQNSEIVVWLWHVSASLLICVFIFYTGSNLWDQSILWVKLQFGIWGWKYISKLQVYCASRITIDGTNISTGEYFPSGYEAGLTPFCKTESILLVNDRGLPMQGAQFPLYWTPKSF